MNKHTNAKHVYISLISPVNSDVLYRAQLKVQLEVLAYSYLRETASSDKLSAAITSLTSV